MVRPGLPDIYLYMNAVTMMNTAATDTSGINRVVGRTPERLDARGSFFEHWDVIQDEATHEPQCPSIRRDRCHCRQSMLLSRARTARADAFLDRQTARPSCVSAT
jgi:hypothetical protein